jgi:tRNA-modifying protein YgfZ
MAEIGEQVAALESGSGFVDLSSWRKVRVSGSDAAGWLNDLLSADLEGLAPGSARPSLLLSPTGRVRAQVSVIGLEDGFLLVQDSIQDAPIDRTLAPYVLSSNVALEDATASLAILAFPASNPPGAIAGRRAAPSALGGGVDVVLPPSGLEEAGASSRAAGMIEAGPEAVETWRIRRGRARVGVDLGPEALPHEAAVDDQIAYHKGCFLGQEAVAKVRNLGHPPFVLLAVEAPSALSAGDPVRSGGKDAGLVTSATADDGHPGSAAIIRVRWSLRDAGLEAADGTSLQVRGVAASP